MKRTLRLLAIASWISFSLTATAKAQTTAPLPPAAQEALDKGIIAAKVPDYALAIRYFGEARKLAPLAPVVLMNLGIAESKMPGRELRAIAWFGAYLTAYPDAPNAAAVKEQIATLDVRNQSNLSRFLKTVQDAAAQMRGYKKNENLKHAAGLWARTGDVAAALIAAALCEVNEGGRAAAYYYVSDAQAKTGDIAGAQKAADMIPQGSRNKILVATYTAYARAAIAEAQAKAGDTAGAQKTFDLALRTAELIPAIDRHSALVEIAKAQAKSSDIAGAQMTVGLIAHKTYQDMARGYVDAEAKFKSGAASAPAGSRRAPKLSDWLRNLDSPNMISAFSFPPDDSDEIPLGNALVKDTAGYLKALPSSYRTPAERMSYGDKLEKPPVDQRMFDALRETAEQLIYAQSKVARMWKAQLAK